MGIYRSLTTPGDAVSLGFSSRLFAVVAGFARDFAWIPRKAPKKQDIVIQWMAKFFEGVGDGVC